MTPLSDDGTKESTCCYVHSFRNIVSHRLQVHAVRHQGCREGSYETPLCWYRKGATSSEAADVSTSADSTIQPAAVTTAVTRHGSTTLDEYELGLIYSGESDPESESKETHTSKEPEPAKPEPARSRSDNALTKERRLDLFGLSDESDFPSPRRSRSVESVRGGGSGP